MVNTESDRRPNRRWLLRFLVPLSLVALWLALRVTLLAPDPIPVRVAPVQRGAVEATVSNSKAGTVKARQRARITAETGGRVVEVRHREGERVARGELLVRLDDRSLRAQRELAVQAERVAAADRERACMARDRAGRELARMQKLAAQKIVSEDGLDELQVAFESAKVACTAADAERDRARASPELARTELAKTRIVAPFDGTVAELSAELGEWVTPSPPLLTSPAVVDLIGDDDLYVSAPMDEVDSGRIRPGQRVRVSVDSRPGEEFAAHVTRVAPYVLDLEAQNRTLEIEAEFDAPEKVVGLLPGTSADVEIVLETHSQTLRIPSAALLEGERVLVFENGVLRERRLRVGLRNWKYAEVLEGLEPGERVIVSLDRVEVKAGARARIDAGETEAAP